MPAANTLSPPPPAVIRRQLHEAVVNDLLGPAGGPEEEVEDDYVSDRYLVGMLAPRRQFVNPELQDELAVEDGDDADDGAAEPSVPARETMLPSSFGLTFCVSGEAAEIRAVARWGHYTRQATEIIRNKDGTSKRVWKREPMEGGISIALAEGPIGIFCPVPECPDVRIEGQARKQDGAWLVTLFLVNAQDEPKRNREETWLFQPELHIDAPARGAVFCRHRMHADRSRMDPLALSEEQSLDMLYRHTTEFVVGHGVAVNAQVSAEDSGLAESVSTSVVPAYELPRQTPRTVTDDLNLKGLVLEMQDLAAAPDGTFGSRLAPLLAAYEHWIAGRRVDAENPDAGLSAYKSPLADALARCDRVLERLKEGVALLDSNPRAAEAFRFANQAMALQRVRSLYARDVRRGGKRPLLEFDVPDNRTWYPFQIAFILINLPGLTNLDHPDRGMEPDATADLLWFPTGGGKTEAYLGLTAYTLAIRRLDGVVEGRRGDSGVAVLMRYTLRLLTLQQFQRATTLICACETIRREALAKGDAKWGIVPFRIGLWVGRKTTPNTTEDSADSIRQDRGFAPGEPGSGSPAQLTSCPWCGIAIAPGKDIQVDVGVSTRHRTFIYCGDPIGNCPFSRRQAPNEGLPSVVVDEDIYRLLPSLLIATVDKFAQMPWRGEPQMLFGQVDGFCPRHGFRSPELADSDSHPRRKDLPAVQTESVGPLRPPDLIIQDELHLISGPLGTLVGLYETAIDELCAWEVGGRKVRPKVIASTATIRRAPLQVHSLFLREVAIFPPHGSDISDNFFALQRSPDDGHPGRLYLGICAPGKRLKLTLIRVYLAFMAAAQQLYDRHGEAADPYMTLVGYFNAMRELGGMRRLVEDDIRSRLPHMDQRGLARRSLLVLEELTSRKGAGDIPRVLDSLEVSFSPASEALRKQARKDGRKSETPMPLDVLLATNMIAVGVDVGRLGLMVVAGQPKTTADYIQASSRVGRSFPGIVCTVYNWARPRDLSHYERFRHYHATFYQHVEALSVTPFSPRALDRGLSGVLASLVRLSGQRFNPNDTAGAMVRTDPQVERAVRAICSRGEGVTGSQAARQLVSEMLESRLDEWDAQARRAVGWRLGYRDKSDGITRGLLRPTGPGAWERFTCLNSLRDVEPTAALILIDTPGLPPDDSAEPPGVAADEGSAA